MNPQGKRSVQIALEILKKAVENRENIVVEGFVNLGPDALRKCLKMENNDDWQLFFDYLVLHKGVVKHCVFQYMDFFYDIVAERGPMALRRIFNIEDSKYDGVYEEMFDLVAVSKGGLYKYVEDNRYEFAMVLKKGNSDGLRMELGLAGKKYLPLWMEILQLLVDSVCDSYADERAIDQGLQTFSLLMNGLREHRSLRSNQKMWSFETQ